MMLITTVEQSWNQLELWSRPSWPDLWCSWVNGLCAVPSGSWVSQQWDGFHVVADCCLSPYQMWSHCSYTWPSSLCTLFPGAPPLCHWLGRDCSIPPQSLLFVGCISTLPPPPPPPQPLGSTLCPPHLMTQDCWGAPFRDRPQASTSNKTFVPIWFWVWAASLLTPPNST